MRSYRCIDIEIAYSQLVLEIASCFYWRPGSCKSALTFCFKSDLQELFFKYSWNNFLHAQVEKCITTVLNNPPTEEDGEQSTPLVDVVSFH